MKKRYVSLLVLTCINLQFFANPGISNEIEAGKFLHEGSNFGEERLSEEPHIPQHGGVTSHRQKPTIQKQMDNIQGQARSISFDQAQKGKGSVVSQKIPFNPRTASDHASLAQKTQQEIARNNASAPKNNPLTMTFDDLDKSENSSTEKTASISDSTQPKDSPKVQTSTIVADVSPEQQAKIEKVKKGLESLQNDKNVGEVFKALGMHGELDALLGKISENADEQVGELDLNKAQEFLKKIVNNKDKIVDFVRTTGNNFLDTFKNVISNNFADLSLKEMGQFFNTTSELLTKAKEANVTKGADDQRAKDIKKPKVSHGFGKGLMHHGSGTGEHAGLPGALFGLAFATAIFAIVQELSNEGV